MRNRRFWIFLTVFLILLSIGTFCIEISTVKKEIPAFDELHITSSNPDILKINNKVFTVEILPNRGRLIWRVYDPEDEKENFIFFSKDPYVLPFEDEITSQYFFEIGGVYLSKPWNPRSNQPYPYEKYDVVQNNDSARIILEGANPIEGIKTKVEVIIKDNDPKIFMNVVVQNLSKNKVSLLIREFTNFDISTGRIITDFSDLDGKKLGDFCEYRLINVNNLRSFGVMKGNITLRKILGNGYSKHYIQIWGKNWEEYVGGIPAVRIVDERPKRNLMPGEKFSFNILFEFVKSK